MRFCTISAFLPVLLFLNSPVCDVPWHISSDGMGDAPTIQAGIDSAAPGDTVELIAILSGRTSTGHFFSSRAKTRALSSRGL